MTRQVVHFLHIGKAGGSAIKAALKGHLETSDCKIILHPHDFSLMDAPIGEKVFFFIRDPVSRFVSGFYSRYRKGQPRYFSPWSRGEKEAFGRFRTPNQLALDIASSDLEVRGEAHAAMSAIEHVRNHYTDWFKDEEYIMSRLPDILFIGRQETLSEDFLRLKRLLRIDESARLPDRYSNEAHMNPLNLDTRLERVAIRNLTNWYARDYALLEVFSGFT